MQTLLSGLSGLLISFTILIGGCAQIPEVCAGCDDPWKASGRNSTFEKPETDDYDDYVTAKREMLDLTKYAPEWTSAAQHKHFTDIVAPARRTPRDEDCEGAGARRGIVLIHGLFDTPFIMRDLADYFTKRCITVFEVLLTGHGARPGDLLSVSRQAWMDEVAHVVKAANQEFEELYIGGFSLGGALSIHAATLCDCIKAVLVFAPALKPKNRLAYGSIVSREFGARYFEAFEEYDFAKYESLSHNAGAETYLLGLEVKEDLKAGFEKPLFVAVSLEDETIDAAYTVKTVGEAPRRAVGRMVIFATRAKAAQAHCRPYEKRKRAGDCRVISSRDLSKGVRSLSHVGLVVDPDNPHYGIEGDYKNCLYSTSHKRLCLEAEITEATCRKHLICYGEAIGATEKPVIRRITFNPFFSELKEEIGRFLQTVEERTYE